MAIHITPGAVEVMRRSLELSGDDEIGVRLRRAGGEIRPRFASEPAPDDVVIEAEGLRVFVDAGIAAEHPDLEIAVTEEHDTLVVRPRSTG